MLFEAAGVEVEPKMAKTEQESQLGANLEPTWSQHEPKKIKVRGQVGQESYKRAHRETQEPPKGSAQRV